jgi:diguanylate cyclase (GGDEF)-like protein
MVREFSHAVRHEWPLSLALIELDGLQRVRETQGELTGGRILQAAAQIVRNNTRETDLIARYNEDQFALLLPATDKDTATIVCERIATAFRQMRPEPGGGAVAMTASIGYATHWKEQRFEEVANFLQAAEQALYTAKLQGRNRTLAYEVTAARPAAQFL